MADQRAEVQKHMTEFQANASRLLGYAQHAHEQYARGDAAGAAMTIALTHYDIGYLEDGRKNLIQAIEQGHSVTPAMRSGRCSTNRLAIRRHDLTARRRMDRETRCSSPVHQFVTGTLRAAP